MPNISLIPEVLYDPLQPYQWIYDNLPLENILLRQELINTAVDINTNILVDSIGTAGTLSNRLNQSLEDSGYLKISAIDVSDHNIAFHADGVRTLTASDISLIDPLDVYQLPSIVPFVRMLEAERDKLLLVSDEATSLRLQLFTEDISNTVLFDDEIVELVDTDTISWEIEEPNKIKARMTFPSSAAHSHNYNLTPVHANIVTPDYINYKTTSVSTVYVENSLRVYINGVRLNEDDLVYVPSAAASPTFTQLKFTENFSAGTFALSGAITAADVIKIDFDISLV